MLVGLVGLLVFLTSTARGRAVAVSVGGAIVKLSQSGLDLIKQFEGFSATPYTDASGHSIGFGHFIRPGESFTSVTPVQAEALLAADTAIADAAVSRLVRVALSQNQHNALVSLVFNIGVGAFENSTLLRRLNSGDYRGAADEFRRWIYSGGVIDHALVDRRAVERELFLRDVK